MCIYDPYESNHDDLAEAYDEQVHKYLDHYIRENYFGILDRIKELLSEAPAASRVLDIGIGTGLLTGRLLPELDLHGVDISRKMMGVLKKKGLDVELREGHFLDLPYEDASFDHIVSTFALHHVPNQLQISAFNEMVRVLEPKGGILVADFMTEDKKQKAALIGRFQQEGRRDMLAEIEEEHFMDIASVKSFLEDIGFNVRYERGSTLSWIFCADR